MGILNFKMAAIRHLGFVIGLLGPRMKSTWWFLSMCSIWLKSEVYVLNIWFSVLCEFALKKCLFTPLLWSFGVKVAEKETFSSFALLIPIFCE